MAKTNYCCPTPKFVLIYTLAELMTVKHERTPADLSLVVDKCTAPPPPRVLMWEKLSSHLR